MASQIFGHQAVAHLYGGCRSHFFEDTETVTASATVCREMLSYYEPGDFSEYETAALLSLQPHLSFEILGAEDYLYTWLQVRQ